DAVVWVHHADNDFTDSFIRNQDCAIGFLGAPHIYTRLERGVNRRADNFSSLQLPLKGYKLGMRIAIWWLRAKSTRQTPTVLPHDDDTDCRRAFIIVALHLCRECS